MIDKVLDGINEVVLWALRNFRLKALVLLQRFLQPQQRLVQGILLIAAAAQLRLKRLVAAERHHKVLNFVAALIAVEAALENPLLLAAGQQSVGGLTLLAVFQLVGGLQGDAL